MHFNLVQNSCFWELQEIIHCEKSEVLRSNQFHFFSCQLVIWGLKASIEKVCFSCVPGCYSHTSLLNICSIISTGFLITSLQKTEKIRVLGCWFYPDHTSKVQIPIEGLAPLIYFFWHGLAPLIRSLGTKMQMQSVSSILALFSAVHNNTEIDTSTNDK